MTSIITTVLLMLLVQVPVTHRIITGSGVRIRSTPQANGTEVGRLALGTVIEEVEISQDGRWYRVATAQHVSGWVSAAFTEVLDDSRRFEAYSKLIRARLEAKPADFAERQDLLEFLDRAILELDEPELELLRLRALHEVAAVVEGEPPDVTKASWLKRHESELIWDRSYDQWFIDVDQYWQLERKYRNRPIGDEIAWAGAKNEVPGECEGTIYCEIGLLVYTDGHYLDLYPHGVHVDAALDSIEEWCSAVMKEKNLPSLAPTDRIDLQKSAANLRSILSQLSSPRKSKILQELADLLRRFGN